MAWLALLCLKRSALSGNFLRHGPSFSVVVVVVTFHSVTRGESGVVALRARLGWSVGHRLSPHWTGVFPSVANYRTGTDGSFQIR
jgi:hypothetical protein